jgi:hypothetical protein
MHAERCGDLPHGQWNAPADLDLEVPYQGRTKPATKAAYILRSVLKMRVQVGNRYEHLRTLATPCSPGNMDCHAGGQGFESPTPRQ